MKKVHELDKNLTESDKIWMSYATIVAKRPLKVLAFVFICILTRVFGLIFLFFGFNQRSRVRIGLAGLGPRVVGLAGHDDVFLCRLKQEIQSR